MLKDGHFYFWYLDYTDKRYPCVTRAPFEDVIAGKTDAWKKYHDGGFTEPGLGGDFTPINTWIGHTSPTWNTYLNRFVVAHGFRRLQLSFSEDGIHWSEPIIIEPEQGSRRWQYTAMTDPGHKETTTGQTFYIYWWDERDIFNTREIRLERPSEDGQP